jgi:hypothetical protein
MQSSASELNKNESSCQDSNINNTNESAKMEKKSVLFSKNLVSDTFYVERIDKSLIKELFYSEEDVVRFQIDVMRSAKKKKEGRQRSRSKSDRATSSKRDKDESPRASPKSKTSSKSSTKKASKASVADRGRRFSNDDIDVYVPRPRDEALKATTQDENISDMDRCETIVSKDEEESAHRSPNSSPRRRPKMQEVEMLKTAVTLRQATTYQAGRKSQEELLAGSDVLDSTRDRSHIGLEPWTQDMLMLKAKQWKERAVFKVSSNPDAFSTDKETKEEKEAPPSPTKKSIADFDLSIESFNKYENASAASTESLSEDEYSDDSSLDLEDLKPTTQDELLTHAKRKVKAKQGETSLSRLVRVLSSNAKNVSKGLGDEKSHEAFSKDLDYVIINKRMYPVV